MYLSVALGIAAVGFTPIRRCLWFVIIAFLLVVTILHKLDNRREDYRSACRDLVSHWKADEAVVTVSGTQEKFSQSPVRYYLRKRPLVLRSIRSVPALQKDLAKSAQGPETLHVVYRDAAYAKPILDKLLRHYTVTVRGSRRFRVEYLKLRHK